MVGYIYLPHNTLIFYLPCEWCLYTLHSWNPESEKSLPKSSCICKTIQEHGPHRFSEKQFQSINTFVQSYDNTNTLIKREKKVLSPFWELNSPYLQELESPLLKDTLCQDWLKLVQMKMWKDCDNIMKYFNQKSLPLRWAKKLNRKIFFFTKSDMNEI